MPAPGEPSDAATVPQGTSVPADKVNLRLLMVRGDTAEFLFTLSDTAQVVADRVYSNWPDNWPLEERPDTNILRLIYQGRFLHNNVTLGALFLPMGKTTVMHLVPRENLPELNSQGKKELKIWHWLTLSFCLSPLF